MGALKRHSAYTTDTSRQIFIMHFCEVCDRSSEQITLKYFENLKNYQCARCVSFYYRQFDQVVETLATRTKDMAFFAPERIKFHKEFIRGYLTGSKNCTRRQTFDDYTKICQNDGSKLTKCKLCRFRRSFLAWNKPPQTGNTKPDCQAIHNELMLLWPDLLREVKENCKYDMQFTSPNSSDSMFDADRDEFIKAGASARTVPSVSSEDSDCKEGGCLSSLSPVVPIKKHLYWHVDEVIYTVETHTSSHEFLKHCAKLNAQPITVQYDRIPRLECMLENNPQADVTMLYNEPGNAA